MKPHRSFYIVLSCWELIRFISIFLSVVYVFIDLISAKSGTIFWLTLLGSSQLILPAGFLIIFFNRQKYAHFVKLLRLGKILGLMPNILLLPYLIIKNNTTYLVILSIILLLDLIFLLVLLSFKEEGKKLASINKENKEIILPDFVETEVNSENQS